MARWYGTTAERGLGAEHVADKKRLLAAHHDGDPCWRCGQPMYKSQNLHRGHVIDRVLGGTNGPAVLEHAACNLAAGARLGNQLQPRFIAAVGRDVRCAACGKPYHYAARSCEMCGAHYHPSYGEQRTCGRACGVELSHRNKRAAGWIPKAERPRPSRRPGPVQSGERGPGNRWPSSRLHHYTCRYCQQPFVTKATAQLREVCESRPCQLARLAANNLRVRHGLAAEEADARVTVIVQEGLSPSMYGRWAASRQW